MKALKLFGKRVFIIAGLALLVFLLMSFNSRMANLTRLGKQQEIEETDLAYVKATKNYLETRVAFAASTKAADAWAREKNGEAMEGDVPIFLMTPEGYTPIPTPRPTPTPPSYTNFEAWIEWFFSSAP
jgi:hypothetical protein